MTDTTPRLSPTQDLFLEVLAGRHRCGEAVWTFERRHRNTATTLATMGLVGWKEGPAPGTILAWLTDTGRQYALDPNYTPPARPLTCPPHHHGTDTWRTLTDDLERV